MRAFGFKYDTKRLKMVYSSRKFWLLCEIFPCISHSVPFHLLRELRERNKDEIVIKLVWNTLYYFFHTTGTLWHLTRACESRVIKISCWWSAHNFSKLSEPEDPFDDARRSKYSLSMVWQRSIRFLYLKHCIFLGVFGKNSSSNQARKPGYKLVHQ